MRGTAFPRSTEVVLPLFCLRWISSRALRVDVATTTLSFNTNDDAVSGAGVSPTTIDPAPTRFVA